jgi:UDP-N-acetylmuramyl pentapeptide phosphotransferase/UDP-N-acetylglucosamine-1-phosphate transferase
VSFALLLASLSFLMMALWGRSFINLVQHLTIGEQVRIDGPDGHINKLGTPTMGGIPIIGPDVTIAVVLNKVSLTGWAGLGRLVLVGPTTDSDDRCYTGVDIRVESA